MEPSASSMFGALKREVKDLKEMIEELIKRIERLEEKESGLRW